MLPQLIEQRPVTGLGSTRIARQEFPHAWLGTQGHGLVALRIYGDEAIHLGGDPFVHEMAFHGGDDGLVDPRQSGGTEQGAKRRKDNQDREGHGQQAPHHVAGPGGRTVLSLA